MHLPDSSTPTILSPLLNHATSDPTCGFEGNDDIYGIGIRIGVYSQLIAVWFSNYFLLSEVQVLRDSVTIFSVAILIVAFIFASNPSEVYAVEAFVLLMILAWGCLMGVCPNSSYSKAVFSRGSLLRMVVCEIVNLMNIALQVWFWWTGLDYMKKTPCGTWLMMYVVKTNLFGWARKVMMAMNVGVLVCTVYWGTVDFVRLWAAWKIRDKRGEFETAIREWEDAQKVGADSDIQEKDSAQDGISDVGDQRSSHSSCSKASCTYCSPTRTDFGLDLLNATHMPPEPLRQGPPQSNRSSWVTAQEASKRSSLITTQEISPPPTRSNSPTSFHEESETAAPNSTSTILHEVHEAEIYIQHCITASPYQLGTDGKPLTFSVIARSILYPKKYRTAEQGKPPPPSWLHCQFYSWAAFLTCRFPPQSFVIYSHLRQSFLLDPLNGPFQTYASITYTAPAVAGEKRSLPTWPAVSIASSLLLTPSLVPKKVWLGWYYACFDLFIHVIAILQLELTLRWNHVRGLSALWTSVGQLIPFIIGVGGLGLVVSRFCVKTWVKRVVRKGGKRGWNVEDGKEDRSAEGGMWKSGVDGAYERWKKAHVAELERHAAAAAT
ncbi:beta-ketoacyl synthase [Stemphylium lycopersici]|uniref:Beta-ketoacyl synthase n=1 Tax=Stemphylium lycopersici TaxID=183478 RepID=A0A364N8E5_STELY|nr:beta-ketoacyl synthase [Stemphylium lycopersici]